MAPLLDNPNEPQSDLSYFDCLDLVMEKSKVCDLPPSPLPPLSFSLPLFLSPSPLPPLPPSSLPLSLSPSLPPSLSPSLSSLPPSLPPSPSLNDVTYMW